MALFFQAEMAWHEHDRSMHLVRTIRSISGYLERFNSNPTCHRSGRDDGLLDSPPFMKG